MISISCTRNQKEERKRNDEFWDLQDEILAAFGERSPAPPRLRLRNVTQTSVTLEWDKLNLATAKLLSLTIWRNGQRLAAIPNPLNNTSTKVSGLEVDAPYSFHLIMRTTAGTYASQTIKTRTLTLSDTSGISVCFGTIDSPDLLDEAKEALTQMKARWSNRIQIETTHFVCTHPSGPAPAVTPPNDSPQEAPDPAVTYQRASQLSIPIVQPAWILACLREKRMVPISAYTLDKAPISGGPSSSVSLGKNASSRSQQAPAQQPRNGPREPIQLQKPPPPKNSPDGGAAPAPADSSQQQSEPEVTAPPAGVQLAPTALPEVEASEPEEEHSTVESAGQVEGSSEPQMSIEPTNDAQIPPSASMEEEPKEVESVVTENASPPAQTNDASFETQQTEESVSEKEDPVPEASKVVQQVSTETATSEPQESAEEAEEAAADSETPATAETDGFKDAQSPPADQSGEPVKAHDEEKKEDDAGSDELEEVKL